MKLFDLRQEVTANSKAVLQGSFFSRRAETFRDVSKSGLLRYECAMVSPQSKLKRRVGIPRCFTILYTACTIRTSYIRRYTKGEHPGNRGDWDVTVFISANLGRSGRCISATPRLGVHTAGRRFTPNLGQIGDDLVVTSGGPKSYLLLLQSALYHGRRGTCQSAALNRRPLHCIFRSGAGRSAPLF